MVIAFVGVCALGVTVCAVSTMVISHLFRRLSQQDNVIKDLTERLVSRNQSEYLATKTYASKPPDDTPPERLSWYDDPMDE